MIPLINDRIINEYLDVLSREKFHLPNEIISKIVESIKAKVISIIEGHIEIELPDEKDRVFYEVVMKSNKERKSFLVTGNIKHFPSKPFIATPRELCDFIINSLCEKDLVNL